MLRGRLLTLLLGLCLLAPVLGEMPARAQPSPGSIALHLVRQPLWRGPDDRLGLRVQIRNQGDVALTGYILSVAVHSRVLSRSALHESFSEPSTFEASRIQAITAPQATIAPGSSTSVEVDDPISSLQSLAIATDGGVYPLTLTLADTTGSEVLASLTTPLIYYPSPPETPLKIVPVVPVNTLPARGPDGRFDVATGTDSSSLEAALADGGWLQGLVAALDDATTPPTPAPPPPRRGRKHGPQQPQQPSGPEPVHLGLAITPRTLEEIADLADGFRRSVDGETIEVKASDASALTARRALARLRQVAGRDSVQTLLVPYSYPDLPTLQENLSNHLRSQLNEAEAVLSAELDAGPSRSWFLPPGGRLDLETLNELQSEKTGRHTFISARALDPLTAVDGGGCPEPALTFACPISVETGSAKTSGFVLDTDLQLLANELENTDEPRVALQRLFAETAMIREELPSRGDRIIDLVLPGLWSPSPAVERELLTGLRDAPWLSTRTPREGLAAMRSLSVEPNTRRILSKLPAPSGSPDISLAPIFEADTALQKFGSVQPPAPLLQRLTRNVLVSESRAWWGDAALQQRGDSYATESTAEAGRELGKITIGKNPSEVRLTSRTAKVPIVVFNEAAYRVAVTVHLESELLQIDETFSETIQAHSLRQLDVDVTVPAQSSGIFPLSVTVETPEGEVIASRPDIRVRSTEFNQIALGLTFGALAFLILFYVTRSIRRRRTGTSEPAQA